MITIPQLYSIYLQHPVVCTDTRAIKNNCLFFALKGDRFDANEFAKQAIESGAVFAIIDNPAYKLNDQFLLVPDALTALQDLARYHRKQITIPVIGLTGSNGKTTTKELIYAVLSEQFNTLATKGNLNNHIGVPLTILNINSKHEIAVIEMGANHQKEIAFLCSICMPTHGLITNVGKAHLEGFGGVEGVKIGKGELYDYLGSREGGKAVSPEDLELNAKEGNSRIFDSVVFVNSNSLDLMKMQADRGLTNTIFYGQNFKGNLVNGWLIENSPFLSVEWVNVPANKTYQVKTQLTGAYNLDNILAAISIGITFGLTDEAINKGIASYAPQNNRSQILHTLTNTVICDYYNANPSSMQVAIENIAKIDGKHKVLILGDMFEMGEEAAHEHLTIAKKAIEVQADLVVFIGKEFHTIREGFQNPKGFLFFEITEEAIGYLRANPINNATILIKGSRGMTLEKLIPFV